MNTYSIHEVSSLLKMGLWQGGEVAGIGYVGAAVIYDRAVSGYGVFGMPIGYDAMIEGCDPSSSGGCELLISVFEPYEGRYLRYRLHGTADHKTLLAGLLLSDVPQSAKKQYGLHMGTVFNFKRRYGAEYTSLRSGKTSSPHGRKLFRT